METVLIVDDEKRIRKIYTQFFSRAGYNVIEASNAVDANDILVRENVDVMLLDINMPKVDGSTLHEITKSFHGRTKVIVASVYPVDDQKRIVKHAAGYYDKSQGLDKLLAEVKAVLHSRRKKILIIDDDPMMRDLFSRLLDNAGYYPVAMGDVNKALRYSKEHQKDIDLIILDLAMPEMDGIDFFDAIKNSQPQTKILISSVYPIDEQETLIFDADDYYDKSEGNSAFLERVNRLL